MDVLVRTTPASAQTFGSFAKQKPSIIYFKKSPECYDALMELHDNDPDRLLGDRGYDSDNIRNDLAERGIEPVIPPRSNRKVPIEYDREAYKRRNLIERCVNRLKQFRRIATRYEKTARAYLSMLCIASTLIWIKTVNAA